MPTFQYCVEVGDSACGVADTHSLTKWDLRVCSNYWVITLPPWWGLFLGAGEEALKKKLRFKRSNADSFPTAGQVGQLFTLGGLFEGSWEIANSVSMCFVDLEKVSDRVPWGVLWGKVRAVPVYSNLCWVRVVPGHWFCLWCSWTEHFKYPCMVFVQTGKEVIRKGLFVPPHHLLSQCERIGVTNVLNIITISTSCPGQHEGVSVAHSHSSRLSYSWSRQAATQFS